MYKKFLLLPVAAVAILVTSACGSKSDSSNGTEEATAVATTPFAISDSEANEMGAPPPGEMSLPKGYDPYAEMAKNSTAEAN